MRKDNEDNFLGPEYNAFKQSDRESYLSVTWCEYFSGSDQEQLRCAIEAIRISRSVGGKACFCVASTPDILGAVRDSGRKARAIYYPEDDNAAHAGVHGISPEDALLLEHLARNIWNSYFTKEAADALPNGACAKSEDVV
jgi:hypothetical protein